MMKLASGAVGQAWNNRKKHDGSVWEHPYQCTRVQDGKHLLNCLRYVDLNMVRAGKVSHPEQWRWCGYDELTCKRQRYRVIDQERLLSLTAFPNMTDFAAFYTASIADRLSRGPQKREEHWTEAVAVGDVEFVKAADRSTSYRRSMDLYEIDGAGSATTWAVRESTDSYSTDSGQESGG